MCRSTISILCFAKCSHLAMNPRLLRNNRRVAYPEQEDRCILDHDGDIEPSDKDEYDEAGAAIILTWTDLAT